MRIRIFRAATLADAMTQVRDELGLDALILETTSQDGLVEVTAAFEPEEDDKLSDPLRFELQPETRALPPPPRLPPARMAAPDIEPLLRHNLPEPLASALRQGSIEDACNRLFRFDRLPVEGDGPPLLLAGPPGSGKTLTVAKLAARLVMEGHRPLVITADEHRAGGVEQLAAFTRLLGLTLIAAGRPEMLRRALQRREAASPVLIDAPGLDLLDPAQAELLHALVETSDAHLALVLPAGLDPAEAVDVASAHAAQGAERLVATRLDRNGRLGGILAASHAAKLSLTEAGIGADVAHGLIPLTSAMLSARLATASALPQSFAPRHPSSGLSSLPPSETRDVLSLHIAAQSGTRPAVAPIGDRHPLWSSNP